HILEGYLIALDNLDEVINLIRSSRDPEIARNGLMERFSLSEIQARAILDMRLQRLTGLEREKIQQEYEEIIALIEDLKDILAKKERRMEIIKDELLQLKDRYGDERRTVVEHSADDITIEDMIPNEEMVITISNQGYIKRTPLVEYKLQGRGGVGSKGVSTKDDDYTEHLFIAHSHNYLLIFTESGKVFWKKVYAIPEGSKIAKGRAIQNLINIESDDSVRAVINVASLKDEDYVNNNFLVMCTENGTIKKTPLEAYSRPRQNGIMAITINEGDRLLNVSLTNGNNHIIIAKSSGKAIHFHESDVRAMGRTAAGVKGVTLEGEDDKVVGMFCVAREDCHLLLVCENGYGMRFSIDEFRIMKRGCKGVKSFNVTEKTGKLVAIKEVTDTDDLMIINKSGIIIRIAVADLRVMGRATQGVRLIRLNDNDAISSIAKVTKIDEDEEVIEAEGIIQEGDNQVENLDTDESGEENRNTE